MKKKKIRKYKRTKVKKLSLWDTLSRLTFAFVAVTGVLTLFLVSNLNSNKASTGRIASNDARNSLQLESFIPATPTPTISNAGCSADSFQLVGEDCVCTDAKIYCKNHTCDHIDPSKSGPVYQNFDCNQTTGANPCVAPYPTQDGYRCWGKPVIYLYPTTSTFVDVTVGTQGKILVSNPLYPEGGWKDVLAMPSGNLIYQGSSYNELFYETVNPATTQPKSGFVLKTNNLEQGLKNIIQRLGLTKQNEQQEFLDWWIPRLQALNAPYIFVSLVNRSDKLKFDDVKISPRPDTFINFIVYFKPLNKAQNIAPLILPATPQRVGFTAVEWGGVIDK